MKTTANQANPSRTTIVKAAGRSLALILAAIALQGCATTETAWMRDVQPPQQTATVSDGDLPMTESRPLVSLLTLSF